MNFTGRVTDGYSGEGIEGISVQAEEARGIIDYHTIRSKRTFSDANGYYDMDMRVFGIYNTLIVGIRSDIVVEPSEFFVADTTSDTKEVYLSVGNTYLFGKEQRNKNRRIDFKIDKTIRLKINTTKLHPLNTITITADGYVIMGTVYDGTDPGNGQYRYIRANGGTINLVCEIRTQSQNYVQYDTLNVPVFGKATFNITY